jgi:superfamily II DNA or RNA helicase
MEAPETIIARFPGLLSFLGSRVWRGKYSASAVQRGLSYANHRSIQKVSYEPSPDGPELKIVAQVLGSRTRPYRTTLHFRWWAGKCIHSSDCSCPVKIRCKHAAALMELCAEDLHQAAGGNLLASEAPASWPGSTSLRSDSWQREFIEDRRPKVEPRAHLYITRIRIGPSFRRHEILVGLPGFRYEDSGPLAPLNSGEEARYVTLRDGTRKIWIRDPQAEETLLRELCREGLQPLTRICPPHFLDSSTRHGLVIADPKPTPRHAWIGWLESPAIWKMRAEGLEIELDASAGLAVREARDFFPSLQTEQESGMDWFRFDLDYELDGERHSLLPMLATLIENEDLYRAAKASGDETLLLSCENPQDGLMRFPRARLLEIADQLSHLLKLLPKDGPVKIHRIHAASLSYALELASTETWRTLAKLGERLHYITSLPMPPVPAGVLADLRSYQREGFAWLQFLREQGLHGILADDMGLGKTLQTLAHLAAEAEKNPGRPTLVVAPTSVVANWAAEAQRFTPHLKVLVLLGKERSQDFQNIRSADLVITSYPLMAKDFKELEPIAWHGVVLDEAQMIKNPRSQTAKAACGLSATFRLCLSGTPMENHLGELWSLMRFLMPGFLGDEKTFTSHFRKPIENGHSALAQEALNRRVAPLILRRTKDQVASDLPPKTEILHWLELSPSQVNLYEAVRAVMDQRVRDAIKARGLAQSQIIVLDALLKLRQICCHPALLEDKGTVKESAKLDFLMEELLPSLLAEGRRILLFSSFSSMLKIIADQLDKAGITHLSLTGQTPGAERAAKVRRFQSGEIPLFLISLKAGGTGLNLTAADTVIHYDPWWNPAAENQATDRAHRIGQDKPVFVHKLITRGSIEARILDLQQKKSALVEALLTADTNGLKMDAETLGHLLAPLEATGVMQSASKGERFEKA